MRGFTQGVLVVAAIALLATAPSAGQDADAPASAPDADDGPTTSPTASSDRGDQEARELFLRGDRRYAEGDYAAAIRDFERAYKLSKRPLLLFNLANAYERTGRYEMAIDALRRYAPDAPEYEADAIARRIQNLEERADSQAATPANAEVEAGSDWSTPSEPAAAGGDEDGDRRVRLAGWCLTGAGAGLVVAGGIAGAIALSARSDARQGCVNGICEGASRDALERDRRASIVADIGLFGGAASLAVGALLLLVFDAPEAAEHARLRLDMHGAQLGFAGSF